MNKKIKLVIYIIIFILVLIGINILYYTLKRNNKEYITKIQEEQNTQEDKNIAINFKVYDKDNNEINLNDYKGKPIVINFWASWCGPCKMEMPDFDEIYKQEKDNVVFLMVNATDGIQETKENALEFVEKEKYSFPIYFDTTQEAVYNYKITGFPTTIFIDKNFNIVIAYQGMIHKDILLQNINKIK